MNCLPWSLWIFLRLQFLLSQSQKVKEPRKKVETGISQNIPKPEDFSLLYVLGKGSFGKVSGGKLKQLGIGGSKWVWIYKHIYLGCILGSFFIHVLTSTMILKRSDIWWKTIESLFKNYLLAFSKYLHLLQEYNVMET